MSQQVTELPDTIPPRRFEYADDTSYKFWTISLSGLLLTTRYGRIGNPGQTHQVRFDSAELAKKDYTRRVERKLKDGYEERLATKKKLVTAEAIWLQLQEHEPFLQAILQEPDDVDSYAIYADWLAERGDPRGEFTLLQLALEDPGLAMYKRPKVENAANLLRQKHVRQWLGNLAPWLMDYGIASYPYDFHRGQLSAISCHVLSLKFAHELRRSPYCRLLRELSIQSSEVVQETMMIDGRRYEAGRDYGLETLVGADFSNLRELRIGMLPDQYSMGQQMFTNTAYVLEMIASMTRLETLYLRANLDLRQLFELDLPHLTSLHLALRPSQLSILAGSGILPRLRSLGCLTPLTESMVDRLIRIPGFDQLTDFSCHDLSRISDEAMEKLRATGIVIDVLHFAG